MKKTICLLIILVMALSFGTASAEDSWNPDVEFTTVDTEGNEWTDRAFADAKLTMVNFWAYWCPPCVGELPDLQKLSENYPDLQILGVSTEDYEEENIKTMKELGITYPTLRIPESIEEKMDSGYIPETMFVDSNGHIIGDTFVGSQSYEEWAAVIEEYLERDPAETAAKDEPDASEADNAGNGDAGSDEVAEGSISCYSGKVRYSAGVWWVPVYMPETSVTNCTSFTLCFRYDNISESMLGEHRVYVSLREDANGAWQEFDHMNIPEQGEIYRAEIKFNKPRTVGGIALYPMNPIDGSSIYASVWIEDPVYG